MVRMLRMGRRRGRSAGVVLPTVLITCATLLVAPAALADDATPAPTPTDTATPAPTPTPAPAPAPSGPPALPPLTMPTALGSWCTALFPPDTVKKERKKAQNLMNGHVQLSKGGTYYLTEHPNWRPQAGTDTSGDRHVNSLDWALPLLYRGVRKQNPVLVDRFRQLLYYWIYDHRGSRAYWTDASIYGGLRTQALVCAAQTLNDPYISAAALRDSQTMIRGFRSHATISLGTNNTDLIRQTGALAAYCWVNDAPGKARAWQNLVSISRGVIHDDGSDVEGSPGYAMYIEKLLTNIESAAATCGIPADPIPALRGQLYQFVAQAVRPDFKLESLGDTVNQSLRDTFGVGDWRADWIRSGGATGTPPTPVYTAFDGGYVFGRGGWNPQPGGPDTFYSLRFSSDRPRTAHTHDDGTAMTLYSRGVEWVGDPGPYRYDNGSSLRWYMMSRPAHSAVTVSGVARTRAGGVKKVTAKSDWQAGGNDTTCVADRTWGSVSVTRCTTYVRSVDVFIVTDHMTAAKIKGKKARKAAAPRVVTERFQLPPGIGATGNGDLLTLQAGDKRMDMYRSGPGGWSVQAARKGSNVGWFTGKWGEKLPGAVVSRAVPLSVRGDAQTAVTVFVPRTDGESVPVTIDANGVTVTRGAVTVTTPLP